MVTLEKILSIPKSFYVSWRLMSFRDAFKLPILVRYNTKLRSLKGRVIKTDRNASMQIGFGTVGIYDETYERCILQIDGILRMGEKIFFGRSSRISVAKNAILEIGSRSGCTAKGTIVCADNVKIGRGCLMSWETLIMDTDWHETINLQSGKLNPMTGVINIGDNVWIGTRSVILKNTTIPDGCIVGSSSLCNKVYDKQNCIIAGAPAVVKKEGVTRYIP